jgi:hypothetical protein
MLPADTQTEQRSGTPEAVNHRGRRSRKETKSGLSGGGITELQYFRAPDRMRELTGNP